LSAQPEPFWRTVTILDRRYASGELTKDQYDQMKHHIEPDRNPS